MAVRATGWLAVAMVLAWQAESRAQTAPATPAGPTAGPSPTTQGAPSALSELEVTTEPSAVQLDGPDASWLILVSGRSHEGRTVDLGGVAEFRTASPHLVVDRRGLVRATGDGPGTVEVAVGGKVTSVNVTATGTGVRRAFNFENDIIPILSRHACNASGCHGKAEGQNGFKLSVFGFDPPADHDALTKEARGRRVFPAAASQSLLLKKISGVLPHGGGVRISRDSREYRILEQWIAAGVPLGKPDDPRVVSVEVTPREGLLSLRGRQQLRVTARYSDGRLVDVTELARFQSNQDGLATVDEFGLVSVGEAPGQVAVMASYMGAVDVFRAIIPRSAAGDPSGPTALPGAGAPHALVHNFIDPPVYEQLNKLNIRPSGPCDDAEFLRRVHLDTIGVLPTAEEARRFLADSRPDKRTILVDDLLRRPEFNDLWALWWADLLRVDRQALGPKGARAYYQWIRESLAANKPLDRFAREILTAQGPLAESPEGQLYVAVTDPGQLASTVSQVFLGVRIACAQCHHHPFDRWSQRDYVGMQSFFAQLGRKSSPAGPVLVVAGQPESRHPRTGERVFAYPLGAEMPEAMPEGDRREVLAAWMTSPENPYFARNIANRLWAHFLGRGLVEPVDDVRATNPPSNPQLLDALAGQVVDTRFDMRAMIRAITASAAYQRSSRPNETNERDEQNASRALFKRIPSEVLLDAVCDTTGVAEKFDGLPAGPRAVQLWDNRVPHYFLRLFGRPVRASACECERTSDTSVSQVLHLMNSPQINEKLAHEAGRIASLAASTSQNPLLVEELYLTFYARYPSEAESAQAIAFLESRGDRRRAAEDLAWSLLNSLEFVFNH